MIFICIERRRVRRIHGRWTPGVPHFTPRKISDRDGVKMKIQYSRKNIEQYFWWETCLEFITLTFTYDCFQLSDTYLTTAFTSRFRHRILTKSQYKGSENFERKFNSIPIVKLSDEQTTTSELYNSR